MASDTSSASVVREIPATRRVSEDDKSLQVNPRTDEAFLFFCFFTVIIMISIDRISSSVQASSVTYANWWTLGG